VIQKTTGRLRRVAVIPHGVSDAFRRPPDQSRWPAEGERPIRIVYVSPVFLYKHQWHVVRAIAELRRRGHDLSLLLAGDGVGNAQARLDAEIQAVDPRGDFIQLAGFVKPADLPPLLAQSDLFLFASICENMPNTLVEGMASALPIACAARGPMPEVLEDGGVYFDPENSASIVSAVEELLAHPARRSSLAKRAAELAGRYSWSRCASETWAFVRETYFSTQSVTGSRPVKRKRSQYSTV
jgi:glycosyltransferase involved in cell wall biosynthesis